MESEAKTIFNWAKMTKEQKAMIMKALKLFCDLYQEQILDKGLIWDQDKQKFV